MGWLGESRLITRFLTLLRALDFCSRVFWCETNQILVQTVWRCLTPRSTKRIGRSRNLGTQNRHGETGWPVFVATPNHLLVPYATLCYAQLVQKTNTCGSLRLQKYRHTEILSKLRGFPTGSIAIGPHYSMAFPTDLGAVWSREKQAIFAELVVGPGFPLGFCTFQCRP